MRFDDSLHTVLAADTSTPTGAQAAWRQLVDLLGRGRVTDEAAALDRLAMLRTAVPPAVRAASARALAASAPGGAIVGFFAREEPAIAAPVLRTARLSDAEWTSLLPQLGPQTRAVLRHRRDLGAAVHRALESFGPSDFVIAGASDAVPLDRSEPAPRSRAPEIPAQPAGPMPPVAPVLPGAFVSVGKVARELPVVAEALRHAGGSGEHGTFRIADLVARIDAYRQQREQQGPAPLPAPPSEPDAAPTRFRFETDIAGTLWWVEGVPRAALVGLSLDLAAGGPVDGIAGGAFRRRQPFADARLLVGGTSVASGAWRLSGQPVFDPATGRFTGYRGTARRPRREDSAEPLVPRANADALRQLVHELRTPTNAISGFAEMIEREMLGPVPPAYRDQAGTIRRHAAGLLTALEDVDLAARLESHRLDLRPAAVALAPLLATVAGDLEPLAQMRGCTLALDVPNTLRVRADDRATERLCGRLLATLVAAAGQGEQLRVTAEAGGRAALLHFPRPTALAGRSAAALLTSGEGDAPAEGGPLLGTGFALRLVRNLAAELGGALEIDAGRLTLRLPAAFTDEVEQAAI